MPRELRGEMCSLGGFAPVVSEWFEKTLAASCAGA